MSSIKDRPLISVVLCTHNPRIDYLDRTLAGLEGQRLDLDNWELLIIDNSSSPPLEHRVNLHWHRAARLIREEHLGLTPARLCGISTAKADVLVFVDDDGVLDSYYLQRAVDFAARYPLLGAWGGSIIAEFEEQPESWTKPYWGMLAIRDVPREVWSNFTGHPHTIPWGVGMCVRKAVADKYRMDSLNDPLRRNLDRKGDSLVSGGDQDLAMVAYDLGLGTGLFPSLRLTHLIPSFRVTEDYLVRLVEAQSYSIIILRALRNQKLDCCHIHPLRRRLGQIRRRLTMSRRERRFLEARLDGQAKALQELSSLSGRPQWRSPQVAVTGSSDTKP